MVPSTVPSSRDVLGHPAVIATVTTAVTGRAGVPAPLCTWDNLTGARLLEQQGAGNPRKRGITLFHVIKQPKSDSPDIVLSAVSVNSFCYLDSGPWGALSSWGLQPPTSHPAGSFARARPPEPMDMGRTHRCQAGCPSPHLATWRCPEPPQGLCTSPRHASGATAPPNLSFPFREMGTMTSIRGVNGLKRGKEVPEPGEADTQQAPARSRP